MLKYAVLKPVLCRILFSPFPPPVQGRFSPFRRRVRYAIMDATLRKGKEAAPMLGEVRSLGLSGISGYEVRAECDLSAGLPAFEIVGLPDAAVKEARDRVRAAIKNCGFTFPVFSQALAYGVIAVR